MTVTVDIDHAEGDWPFTSKNITIPPGGNGYWGGWTPIDDSLVEGNEQFTFTLSNPVNATLGSPSSATTTVVDNDFPPMIDIDVTALDQIMANGLVEEGEGFRVTGTVYDPTTAALAEVLLKFDLNFDGDTGDANEEVEVTLTPDWYAHYWRFSLDVTPVVDDGPSGPWSNETPSDPLTVIAELTDADSGFNLTDQVVIDVFNFAPQFVDDPAVTYELDAEGHVVSATVSGEFNDPGSEDYHQVAVSWAVDAGFNGQEPVLLPLGGRSFAITRLFESGEEIEIDDLFPIIVDVIDDDNGTDAFVAEGARERYRLTYSIEEDAEEHEEKPALLRLSLDRPAPTGGITVGWQPLLLPDEDPSSKDIAQASDFHNASGTWTFAEGQQEKTIELRPIDDQTIEKNEKMKLTMPWVTTEDYVVTTTGTGFLGFWSPVKILDDEWRFVNPGGQHFEIDSSGSWHPVFQNVINVDTWIWSFGVPIGRFIGNAAIAYDGFDGVQAVSEATGLYGTVEEAAFRESNMEFSVHSQTGDIVRNDGAPISGNSEDGSIEADIGYNWLVGNFGPNEKRVSVTYQLALGYDVDISATTTIGVDAISISFTGGGPNYKYGVDERQLSLIARNRVSDDNTGLEWQD